MASKKKKKPAKKTAKKKTPKKPAKKKTPKKKAPKKKAPTKKTGPLVLDEALEEPLVDASTILRVKDRVARSQRDVDEDERNQFSDPSLVVEAQTRDSRPDGDDDSIDESVGQLPNLFADEARRQKARLRDSAARPAPRDDSLFGLHDSDDDSDED